MVESMTIEEAFLNPTPTLSPMQGFYFSHYIGIYYEKEWPLLKQYVQVPLPGIHDGAVSRHGLYWGPLDLRSTTPEANLPAPPPSPSPTPITQRIQTELSLLAYLLVNPKDLPRASIINGSLTYFYTKMNVLYICILPSGFNAPIMLFVQNSLQRFSFRLLLTIVGMANFLKIQCKDLQCGYVSD